jgi:hypothetical protein
MGIQEALARKMGGKKKKAGPPDKGDPIDASVTIEDDDTAGTGNNDEDITAGAGTTAEEKGDGADMSSYEGVEDSAASDVFDAAKSGDKEGFKTALSQYVEACIKRHSKG